MDLVLVLRSSFVLASVMMITIIAIPALRVRYLSYGPRTVAKKEHNPKKKSGTQSASVAPRQSTTAAGRFADHLASYRVPRTWFGHFYVYAFSASLFWGYQIWTQGPTFQKVAKHVHLKDEEAMSSEQVLLLWIMFTFQVFRRLMEHLTLTKPTTGTLWVLHWIVALGFYVAMNLSVWIEGIPSLLKDPITAETFDRLPALLSKNMLPLMLFAFGSFTQNKAHRHLRTLPSAPNYTIPTDRVFARTLTPHYFAEYLIYLAMAIVAAPPWYFANLTLACAAVFVAVNLGVTANETRIWYVERFGEEAIRGKARMVPGVW